MLTKKLTSQLQISYSVAQLIDVLSKGRQSGEEKGWLSLEDVKQHINERYRNKH